MTSQLTEAWRTIVPAKGSPHGPLPGLLVLLTVLTGLVDAFSYLQLGRVFVANMTGNVVFLAFALGGAPGFIWWASLLGIAAFLVGAWVGGRVSAAHGTHSGRHLLLAVVIQAGLVLAAFIAAVLLPSPYETVGLVILILLLGIGMGLQNATARALAIPDLTTTVLTLTIAGISADSRAAGGQSSRIGRRFVSILSMFIGALVGALIIMHWGLGWLVLLIAFLILIVIVAFAIPASRSGEAWTTRS